MARKKVIDLNADTTIKFEKPGQVVEGYYLGFKTVTSKFGPSLLHVFQTAAGSLGAWGSTQLDSKLATIQKGVMVYVTYLKKIPVPSGSMKTFDVEFDNDLKIDVSGSVINYAETKEPEESNEDQSAQAEQQQDVDPEEPPAEEDAAPEPTPVAAPLKKGTAVVNAAQASKAQALLNKTRQKIA